MPSAFMSCFFKLAISCSFSLILARTSFNSSWLSTSIAAGLLLDVEERPESFIFFLHQFKRDTMMVTRDSLKAKLAGRTKKGERRHVEASHNESPTDVTENFIPRMH